jgi:hypothetical protein
MDMSTNRNHTHTGNCQGCGSEHAIDIIKGTVAKHGYTVDWGSFNGVCSGADRLPAQKSVEYTEYMIKVCVETAGRLDAHALDLERNVADPIKCVHYDPDAVRKTSWGTERKGANVEIPYAQGTADEQKRARVNDINEARYHANGNRDHAIFLAKSVLPLLGTELISVEQAEVRRMTERATREAKPTKAAFNRRLESLKSKYNKARDAIHTELLKIDRELRVGAWTKAYDTPYSLNNWRAKHAETVLAVIPAMAATVTAINELYDQRLEIKAEQKAAGL